jgi:hypothetical protein
MFPLWNEPKDDTCCRNLHSKIWPYRHLTIFGTLFLIEDEEFPKLYCFHLQGLLTNVSFSRNINPVAEKLLMKFLDTQNPESTVFMNTYKYNTHTN